MKVWERINQLKGTSAAKETIASWAYLNRVCPRDFSLELELDCEYPKELDEISRKICDDFGCGFGCLIEFLESEVE